LHLKAVVFKAHRAACRILSSKQLFIPSALVDLPYALAQNPKLFEDLVICKYRWLT